MGAFSKVGYALLLVKRLTVELQMIGWGLNTSVHMRQSVHAATRLMLLQTSRAAAQVYASDVTSLMQV